MGRFWVKKCHGEVISRDGSPRPWPVEATCKSGLESNPQRLKGWALGCLSVWYMQYINIHVFVYANSFGDCVCVF